MRMSWKKDNGQALVEFALVLPILLLLLVGIVDFGMIFFKWLAVEHTARDAARYASLGGSTNDAKTLAINELKTAGMQNARVSISLAPYDSSSSSGSTGNENHSGSNTAVGPPSDTGSSPSTWSDAQWMNWLQGWWNTWAGQSQGTTWPGNFPWTSWGESGNGSGSSSASQLQLNQVTVSIDYPVPLFDPIMASLLGNPFDVHSTVTMLVEPSGNGTAQGSGSDQGNQSGDSQGRQNGGDHTGD